jgi:hypothetical protein
MALITTNPLGATTTIQADIRLNPDPLKSPPDASGGDLEGGLGEAGLPIAQKIPIRYNSRTCHLEED